MTPATFVLRQLIGESGESGYLYRNNCQSTIVQEQIFGINEHLFNVVYIFW